MSIANKFTQVALVILATHGVASAGDSGSIYALAGTNGIGLGYAKSVGNDFALRGQINGLPSRSYTGNVGDFGNSTLTAKVSLSSAQVVGDWYPTASGFRVSGGVVFNNNKIDVTGSGQVNDKSASVDAKIKMSPNGVAPYLGVGYSTRPKDATGFGFVLDLGVMFQNPTSTLSATGIGVTITEADIAAQNAKVKDAIKRLKYYPVIGVGVSYAF